MPPCPVGSVFICHVTHTLLRFFRVWLDGTWLLQSGAHMLSAGESEQKVLVHFTGGIVGKTSLCGSESETGEESGVWVRFLKGWDIRCIWHTKWSIWMCHVIKIWVVCSFHLVNELQKVLALNINSAALSGNRNTTAERSSLLGNAALLPPLIRLLCTGVGSTWQIFNLLIVFPVLYFAFETLFAA